MPSAGDTYADLGEAVMRGALSRPLGEGFRDTYTIARDKWNRMLAALLLEVLADAWSTAEAAQILDMPIEHVEARIRGITRTSERMIQDAYVVPFDRWKVMHRTLLLAIFEDAGSGRAAAKLLGVPRTTLAAWVRRARSTR
jgi:DNA-directed RNA polymerase specialized sigma24 family protein